MLNEVVGYFVQRVVDSHFHLYSSNGGLTVTNLGILIPLFDSAKVDNVAEENGNFNRVDLKITCLVANNLMAI